MTLTVSLYTAAVLGLLLVVLSARVSQLRMRHQISLGDGGNRDLGRFIRLHANTAEQVPIFLVLALIYEASTGSSLNLTAVCVVFVVARLLYTWGMWTKAFTRQRQIGALLSLIAQAWLAIALLLIAAGRAA